MRVVIALDSFKGSITAAAAAAALSAGWLSVRPGDEVVALPMADGGEGTLEAFEAAVPGARRMPVQVRGPHGREVQASWLLLPPTTDAPDGTGVVELASTSGIELLGEDRLPWDADTTGFGQAIADAVAHGVSRLVVGIGSSASTDAGAGLLTALGARFLDHDGEPIQPGLRGLATAATAYLSGLVPLPPSGVQVLSDVNNPLLGDHGAAAIFGPQKGLDAAEVPEADAALQHFAAVTEQQLGAADIADAAVAGGLAAAVAAGFAGAEALTPQNMGEDAFGAVCELAAVPGAGAAGGAGFGLLVWGAELALGSAAVAELVGLAEAIATADLVITGEGSFDGQSASGKAPAHVAELAGQARVPALLAAGRIAAEAETAEFAGAVSLIELAGSAQQAIADPERWLQQAGAELARRVESG